MNSNIRITRTSGGRFMIRRKKRNIIVTLAVVIGNVLMSRLGAMAVAAAIGGFFFDYSLMTIFAKDIPWYADCIVGLVTCPVTVAIGLGCWVAVLCDVSPPFVSHVTPVAEAPMEVGS